MSRCTAAQAISAFEYWLGYYEKGSSKYITRRDKAVFELDKGSANYTYPGYICGIPDGAWCAMMDALAIYEACGNSKTDAKAVMHGVWPYANCGQLWDAAPSNMKGKRGAWTPKPGDVIVFTDNGTIRSHTGMVYAVDSTYIYTMEGNSSNMCKRRSYLLTSTYIYGYVRPAYAAGAEPVIAGKLYGAVCCKDPELHELSKGCAGPEVKTIQRIIFARGIDKTMTVDGDFGKATKAGVIALQKQLFPNTSSEWDGVVGAKTWPAALKMLD